MEKPLLGENATHHIRLRPTYFKKPTPTFGLRGVSYLVETRKRGFWHLFDMWDVVRATTSYSEAEKEFNGLCEK